MEKEHEFIDEMFERLLVVANMTFGDAFETIIQERAIKIVDLGRIENAYQLFRKKYPDAPQDSFRNYIQLTRPNDFEKCVNCFNWKRL